MAAEEEVKSKKRLKRPSKDHLNFVIAVSAVLISAASFIATYIQSEASLNQVKAETWPYLQVEHGNVNDDLNREIYFHLENVGVGPAKVKSFRIKLQDRYLNDAYHLVELVFDEGGTLSCESNNCLFTNTVSPKILPQGDVLKVFSLFPDEQNLPLWYTLNTVRWRLQPEACYCSLLDECYETNFDTEPTPVEKCKIAPKQEFARS